MLYMIIALFRVENHLKTALYAVDKIYFSLRG
jgi:hypothetical protein